MTKIIDRGLTENNSESPAAEQLAREQAIKQIERKRRFWTGAAWSGIGMLILVIIWAMTEYHNAGGWPRDSARVQGSMTCGITGSSTRSAPGCWC